MRLGMVGVAGTASWLGCVLALALVGCSGQADGDGESDRDVGASNDSGSGSASEVPEDCEDVLAPRKELPDCGSAGCRVIEETPERVVQWWIYVRGDRAAGDEVAWHRLDCVERQVQELGLTLVDSNGGDVVVVASYEAIESVIHTEAIEYLEAACVDDDCACTDHEEAACAGDPLCAVVSGVRLDTGSSCPVFVECVRYDSFCVSFVPTLDEAGACWRFPSGCLPEGFTSLPLEGTAGCTDADFEALAPCAD